jgi:murein DD-endopeptidase MepM/ murein hydrolase activator NlpD
LFGNTNIKGRELGSIPTLVLVVGGLAAVAGAVWLVNQIGRLLERALGVVAVAGGGILILFVFLGTLHYVQHPPPAQALAPVPKAPAQPPVSSGLICPTPGARITQGFGPSDVQINGVFIEPPYDGYPHFHVGLDLASNSGTPIRSAESGVVEGAGLEASGFRGYGNVVFVRASSGMKELYAHLSVVQVSIGQVVSQGQRLGLVGSTGASTGPHLHFGIFQDGKWVDPQSMMQPC